jgi:hypothetical protein
MNRSSVVVDGKPVYPDFRRDLHVATKHIEPIPGLPIIVGLDFGRQPAALCCQNLRGRWYVLREIIGRDMGANKFAPIVKGDLSTHFPGHEFHFWGDPSGGYQGQADDTTPFKVFEAHGMRVRPAPGNNLGSLRKEAVETVLCRTIEGKPSLLVDPSCTTFITGMSGGYHFRRLQTSGERYADEPNKNQYSHVCEAFEYAVLGGGEGRGVDEGLGAAENRANVQTRTPYNPFFRANTARGRRSFGAGDAARPRPTRSDPAHSYAPPRLWLIFFGEAGAGWWWTWFFRRGFRHVCAASWYAGAERWVYFNPVARGTVLEVMTDAEFGPRFQQLIRDSSAILRMRTVHERSNPPAAFFCVGAIKGLLGIKGK